MTGSLAHGEILRLFMAADRHLSKADPATRARIMEQARFVILTGDARHLRTLGQFIAGLGVPAGTRASVTGVVRRTMALAHGVIPPPRAAAALVAAVTADNDNRMPSEANDLEGNTHPC